MKPARNGDKQCTFLKKLGLKLLKSGLNQTVLLVWLFKSLAVIMFCVGTRQEQGAAPANLPLAKTLLNLCTSVVLKKVFQQNDTSRVQSGPA